MKQIALFPPTIDEMCQSAMADLVEYVNRAAGQHCFHVTMGFREMRLRVWEALL